MDTKIEVKELADQPVVGVRFKTTLASIGENIGKAFGLLFGYIGMSGATVAGPPMAIYHDEEFKEDDIDAEVCVPVSKVLPGEADIRGWVLPGGMVASTVHTGSYSDIGPTYETLMQWIRENDFMPIGPPREIYLSDPNTGTDPSQNRTEVVFPVEKSG